MAERYTVIGNRCRYHPETCSCAPWRVLKDGERFLSAMTRAAADAAAAALNVADGVPGDAVLGALLTKLPTLDPTWPEAVQDGWMRCFNALRALAAGVQGRRLTESERMIEAAAAGVAPTPAAKPQACRTEAECTNPEWCASRTCYRTFGVALPLDTPEQHRYWALGWNDCAAAVERTVGHPVVDKVKPASGVQASDRYQQSNGPAMVREALKTTLEIAAAAGVKGPEHG